MKPQQLSGSLYAILSGFLYGFVGYFGLSVVREGMTESTMTFWRFFIATAVMFLILLPQLRKLRYSWQEMGVTFLTGAIFYGFSSLLFFIACRYISSGIGMVIFFTYPVFILIINSLFFKESIPKIYYFSLAIILLGMLFMINKNQLSFELNGVLLALLSALFYAFYIITNKHSNISAKWATFIVSLGCTCSSLSLSLFNNSFSMPKTIVSWFNLLGIGIVSTVIPILLLLKSLKQISSSKASILSVLEPVFVVIFGVLLLGETTSYLTLLGIFLVLGGALTTLFSSTIP